MKLADVEAVIWYQAHRLVSKDELARTTAMDAIEVAIRAYAEDAAGRIIRQRRAALRSDLESTYAGRPST